jgi:hypothetical protein
MSAVPSKEARRSTFLGYFDSAEHALKIMRAGRSPAISPSKCVNVPDSSSVSGLSISLADLEMETEAVCAAASALPIDRPKLWSLLSRVRLYVKSKFLEQLPNSEREAAPPEPGAVNVPDSTVSGEAAPPEPEPGAVNVPDSTVCGRSISALADLEMEAEAVCAAASALPIDRTKLLRVLSRVRLWCAQYLGKSEDWRHQMFVDTELAIEDARIELLRLLSADLADTANDKGSDQAVPVSSLAFTYGKLRLDRTTNTVSLGTKSETIRHPRAFNVLWYIAQAKGQVVRAPEIQSHVPGCKGRIDIVLRPLPDWVRKLVISQPGRAGGYVLRLPEK